MGLSLRRVEVTERVSRSRSDESAMRNFEDHLSMENECDA
jgi:hypothetical protein